MTAPKKTTSQTTTARVLPEYMQIGPYNVRIVLDKEEMERARVRHSNLDACGLCDHQRQTIYIDPDMEIDAIVDTLLHEIMHFIFYITGGTNELGAEQEEKVILFLGSMLLDTIRRNPDVAKALLGNYDS